jgi:PAS domain S-box-containing protein
VAEGRADFGVGSIDILVARDQGIPLVILASIFQRSPYAMMSLSDTPLATPQDLVGKRIAYQEGALGGMEVDALLDTARIDREAIVRVPFQPGVDPLVAGAFDVGVSYPSSALWRAKELGVELNLLYPSDFETPFYGDTLFTHRRLLDVNPDLVRRFRDATLRGWQYAMDRPDEIAERIARELKPVLPVEDFHAFCRFEAGMVRDWMRYPEVEIGATNSWRWNGIYRQLSRAGLVKGGAAMGGLVFDDYRVPGVGTGASRSALVLFLIAFGIALILVILFLFTSMKHWGLPAAASAIILAGTYLVDQAQREARVQDYRYQIAGQIGGLRSQVEGSLRADVQLVKSLAAFIAMNPDLTQEEFATFASSLLDQHPTIRATVAAPDLVVRFAHPLEKNQAVIGLDYQTHPTQREAALRAVESDVEIIAGPLELLQGGKGLVVRYPVLLPPNPDTGERKLWGLVGGSLDFNKLAAATGLTNLSNSLDIALRGRDGLGDAGEVFFGDGALFNREPVLQDVTFSSGKWQIAAEPRGGWTAVDRPAFLTWATGCMLLSLVLAMLIYRQRQALKEEANAQRIVALEATRARAQALAKVSTIKHDFDTKQVILSPEFCELIGLEPVEIAIPEKEFLLHVHPRDRERLEKLGDFGKRSLARFSTEVALLHKDGRGIEVLMQSEVASRKGVHPASSFITVQDISERYEAQAALRESEERFTLAMLGSNDMLWDANLLTGKVYYSPRFREVLGMGAEAIEGTPEMAIEHFHPEDRDRALAEFRSALRGKAEKTEIEFRMIGGEGEVLDILSRALVVRDEEGTPVRLVGTNVDLTPVKRAERAALKLQEELQQAHKMESIGHLAGGIAHDFNNILASILGYAELSESELRVDGAADRIERYLREVENAALRGRDLVRQLLTFSRPGKAAEESVNIGDAVQEALGILRSTLPATITLETELGEQPLHTRASPSQLHQLLLNLVINARDAIPEVGRIRVELRRGQASEQVCASCGQHFSGEYGVISVSDNGCGIPPEDVARIFEPFYTSKELGKGSGMGLAVVHGTLHGMAGHLTVESKVGQGTEMRVFLPLLQDASPAAKAAPAMSTPEALRGCRILLAEDEAAVAGFLSEALRQAGFEVEHCEDGRKALEHFSANPDRFDLVITDHSMPHMSGTRLAERIREARPELPIILVSGFTEPDEGSSLAQPPVSIVLQKPVRLANLLAAIREVLTAQSS